MAQGGNLWQDDDAAVTRVSGEEAGTLGQARSAERSLTTETEIDTETRRLREQIDDTRAHMSDTVNALQDRLQPERLVSDARGAIRDAVAQRARSAADAAIDVAHRVNDGAIESVATAWERAKANPWSASAVAIGSAGALAWLLSRSTRMRSHMTDGRRDDNASHESHWEIGAESNGRTRARAGAPLALAAAAGLVYWMARPSEAGESTAPFTARATSVATQAADYATEVRAMMDERASDARETIDRWLRENPLGVGAVAFALGAIAGLALPESENEERVMQSAVHSLIDSFASGPSAFGGPHHTSH